MNYYPFHLGDYAAHTAHLEPMEDLAYRRMLDLYYLRECALPQDPAEVARLIRMRGNVADVEAVLREFFTSDDGNGWIHVRCESEIAKMQDKQAKAKASAQASVNARAANAQRALNERSTDVELPTPTPTPTPNEIPSLLTQAPARQTPDGPQLALVDAPKPRAKTVPDCPHQAILALWAEVLPALPQHNPDMWNGARADHLRARWRETAASKGWESESEGLTYFRRLFAYIGQSAFLTGKAKPVQGKPPFIAELAWVVSPQSWAKVHEGKYHSEAA